MPNWNFLFKTQKQTNLERFAGKHIHNICVGAGTCAYVCIYLCMYACMRMHVCMQIGR